MLFDAAVLYDEYNDYVREWIETDLIERAETQKLSDLGLNSILRTRERN